MEMAPDWAQLPIPVDASLRHTDIHMAFAASQLLLDEDADANAQGGKYENALQAASYNGHKNVVQLLLDAGADVNAQDGEYGTALQAAIYKGYEDIVQLLLDTGARYRC
ncbi:ankyrin [Dendrothele bispora CBS 962.96]|uniref:Ankyrin n=1 Tax=Dendrothele bispora (strain CBS 962.96) TaxID=1314807 RepID=A0A4S8LL70_DENBC|nr:ankyrin [Dendrothele bispora CBS 962.96]